jgi:M6 family metalloprotease-like protein
MGRQGGHMKREISPRIYYSALCSAFLAAIVVLIGSTASRAQTSSTLPDSPAAARMRAFNNSFLQSSSVSSPTTDSSSLVARGRLGQQWPTFLLLVSGLAFGVPLFVWDARLARRRTLAFFKQFAVFGLVFTLAISSSPLVYAQNSCGSTGVQNLAVLAVNIPGATLPPSSSIQNLQDIFFGTNIPGINVAESLGEASYGQVTVTGTVFGPYNLTGTYTGCSDVYSGILSDAITAATSAGVNLTNYNRFVLIFPNSPAWSGTCAGDASVGSCTFTTSSGTTYGAGAVAINANFITDYTQYNVTARQEGVSLGCHEIGHSLGILHSGMLTPAIASDIVGPLSSPGTLNDGGDNQVCNDQGAVGYLGQFPAPEKAAVSWLQQNSNGYQLVQSPGTYTIVPTEAGSSGLQALKVQRGTNNAGYYLWLEYRLQAGPYDSTSAYGSGVFVHYQDPTTDYRQGYLLNFNPQLNTIGGVWLNPEMLAGQTWSDNYSDVSISLTNVSATSATISIGYTNGGGNPGGGGSSTPSNALSATVAVPSSSYTKNQTVSVMGAVSYSGVPDPGANVTFLLTAPNGKNVKQNTTTGPNGQASWAYSLGKHPASGTYSVVVNATSNGSTTTSAPATFVVQ